MPYLLFLHPLLLLLQLLFFIRDIKYSVYISSTRITGESFLLTIFFSFFHILLQCVAAWQVVGTQVHILAASLDITFIYDAVYSVIQVTYLYVHTQRDMIFCRLKYRKRLWIECLECTIMLLCILCTLIHYCLIVHIKC